MGRPDTRRNYQNFNQSSIKTSKMKLTPRTAKDGYGKPLDFYEVSDRDYEVKMEIYSIEKPCQYTKNSSIEQIREYNEHLRTVSDWKPVLPTKKISYIVSPKSFMYYSKKLNKLRFPNIGEYYSRSSFVN